MSRQDGDASAREGFLWLRQENPSLVRSDLIAVAIPALLGLVLAAVELSTRSLWLDEGSTFAIASQHGAALWRGIKGDGGNMLAYYLLMHAVISWFGHAIWVLRLPSVLANGVTGALVAAIGIRLFADRRIAIAGGLLTVVSLPLVFWGQNVRGYALLVTLATASFLTLIAILQTPAGRAPGRGVVAGYVLTTLAALYVGYDVALVIPAQLALLLVFRERARVVISCLAVVLVLCIPLLVLAAQRGSGQLFWVPALTWNFAHQAVLTLISAGMPPDFHDTATTVATEIVMSLAVIAALVLAVRAVMRSRTRRPGSWQLLLVLAWTLIPTVLGLVLYAAGQPIELARITILMMPALALLLAWALFQPFIPPALSIFLCAVLLVLRLAQVIPNYGVSPEDWKAATAYVVANTSADRPACIIFYPQDGREPFDYYLPAGGSSRTALTPALPPLPWPTVRPFVERYGTLGAGQRASIVSGCSRLWLVSSHQGNRDGTTQSRVHLARYSALEQALGRLYPQTRQRVFGWSSTVRVRLFYR